MTHDIKLPPCCTLVQADALAQDLRAALALPGDALHIDARDVEEADVSLLQLLIAARHSGEATGTALRFTMSPTVADLARRAGLQAGDAGLSLPP